MYVFYSSWESVLYRARKNSSRPFSARLHFLLRVAFVNKSQTAFSRIVNRVIQHIFGKSTYNKNQTLENNTWRLWLKLCWCPNLKRYPDYKAAFWPLQWDFYVISIHCARRIVSVHFHNQSFLLCLAQSLIDLFNLTVNQIGWRIGFSHPNVLTWNIRWFFKSFCFSCECKFWPGSDK